MIRKELKEYIDGLESNLRPIDEFSIGQKIRDILKAKEEEIPSKHELAEYIAFQFVPDYPNKETGWGTYYGPMSVLPNEQGQFVEFPSIQRVDGEILTYWRERANTVHHPSFACRYGDLVVDFEPRVKGTSIDYKLAQKVIDSTILICEEDLSNGLDCKTKLERALTLARQINDSTRLESLKKTIITTERKFAEDDKTGLWGYAFERLLLEGVPKITLDPREKDELIKDLEQRLERLQEQDDPDPWLAECAVRLLAEYYSKIRNETALKSVLDKLEAVFRANKRANSDGLLVVNYLEKLSEIYLRYSQFEFARKAASRITTELSSLGDRGNFAMDEISVELPIKTEDIEKFIDSIFGEQRSAQIEKVVAKLAVDFIPKKDFVERQLKDTSQEHPLRYLVTHAVMSEDGFPIAKFGPINEDYDQHLLQHFSQNLHFQSPFLRWAFEELRKRYTPEILYGVLSLSPVFRGEDRDYILKTLQSFWERDYLPSCSLMIPLIEDAVRNIYRINGLSFIKKSEDGTGYDVLSLHRLLNQGVIEAIFQSLGESVEYYFKVLLTARVGWNLRNIFAHGINKNVFAGEDVANRLLHVLLCLSLIRKK